jgi:hypothetical protein
MTTDRAISLGFLTFVLPHILSLFLFSSILFLYSFRLIFLLSQSNDSSPESSPLYQVQIILIRRISIVTVICIVCYLLRIVVYGISSYDVFYSHNHSSYIYDNPKVTEVIWYLITDWIPCIIPVLPNYNLSNNIVECDLSTYHENN